MEFKSNHWVRLTAHTTFRSDVSSVTDYMDARLFGTRKFSRYQWKLSEAAENLIMSYPNN